MRYKGQKGLEVESQVGLLSVDRGHYYRTYARHILIAGVLSCWRR
jgi:hypothetical protein